MSKAAIFLDRDGTVNFEVGYLHKTTDWKWVPGVIEAIKLLNASGFLVIIVSNQSGIARGKYTRADVDKLHAYVNSELQLQGGTIDEFYYCEHHPEHGDTRECACRKPKTGMINQACNDYDIDLDKSWLIGDKLTDVKTGENAGVSTVLVLTGYGENCLHSVNPSQKLASDLLDAVRQYIVC
jgi:D-glycero-D-manno-heptose 1,7-bisphosphate phosphatase